MAIRTELLDEILKDYKNPEELLGKDGILKELKKAIMEMALAGELTHHLGYEKYSPQGKNSGNSRNGKSFKRVKTKSGEAEIEIPRDRNGSFDPQLIKKAQTRFEGIDSKIISMYSRGMTPRDIRGHLLDMYGVEVSAEFISTVTDSVMEEVTAWQRRPLDAVYPIVYLDALHAKMKDNGHIVNRAVYVALGVDMDGQKDVLGVWVGQAEGAKFWLKVVTELKNRGVRDILIACVHGLKGFPETIEAVFPQAQVQLCVAYMVRNSLRFVPWRVTCKGFIPRSKPKRPGRPWRLSRASGKSSPTISESWLRN